MPARVHSAEDRDLAREVAVGRVDGNRRHWKSEHRGLKHSLLRLRVRLHRAGSQDVHRRRRLKSHTRPRNGDGQGVDAERTVHDRLPDALRLELPLSVLADRPLERRSRRLARRLCECDGQRAAIRRLERHLGYAKVCELAVVAEDSARERHALGRHFDGLLEIGQGRRDLEREKALGVR